MAQQTAVEWLEKELKDRYPLMNSEPFFEQAKQMEKEQLENARPQIISNCVIKEISDEEIEKAANEHLIFWRGKNHHLTNPIHADRTINDFKAAIKWYREQLKNGVHET